MIKRLYRNLLLACVTGMALVSCQGGGAQEVDLPEATDQPALADGAWRAVIQLNDSTPLAFKVNVGAADSGYSFDIVNAEEVVNAVLEQSGDSVHITMPVFANYIEAAIVDSQHLEGHYVNPDADNYRLPFRAEHTEASRYASSGSAGVQIDGEWRVEFETGTPGQYPAIAYFEQNQDHLTGTFRTETGDYRFLDGVISDSTLQLSAFDGAHLFYFRAQVHSDTIRGRFYSGRSYMAEWKGYRDEDFRLRDAEELTYLKEGYNSLEFAFPDLSGDTVRLSDERFQGKPVIVQIMGSWCPNCMDESRYLKTVKEEFGDNIAIVGLTFERARDEATALKRAQKMKNDMALPYPVLLAGATRQDKAEEALPILNHVMSYPTTIYLNEVGEVMKIHTGFSGPGTPVYDDFVAKNRNFIQSLIETSKP